MPNLARDAVYAIRGLRKNPVLAGAALLSLALGIGANTAIFSLTDQVLLRSLPVTDPARLVLFSAQGRKSGFVESNYDDTYAFSYPLYCDFRDRAPLTQGVLARFPQFLSMTSGDRTEMVQGELVSGNYFDVLGAGMALGRPLTPADDRVGSPNPVAVLSYKFWKRRFALAPSVLNQTLRVNGMVVTIVGVAHSGFHGVAAGEQPDVFVPITMQPRLSRMFDGIPSRRGYWLNIFARLKPGVTRQQAESALNVFWKPILEEEARNTPQASQKYRQQFTSRHLTVEPGQRGISAVRSQAAGPLLVLMSMAGVLVLIACANIASLLIARAAGRQKEIAIRLAVGAGRWRLLRQLLVEGVTLALAGGMLGVLTAFWTGDLLLGYLPSDPAFRGLAAQPEARVLLFALGLSLFTGVIFGFAPAWESFGTDVASILKQQSASTLGSIVQVRFRKGLVVVQVALSLVLLIGAGLFARSLYNIKQIDPGFRTESLLTFAVQPSLNGYDQGRTLALYDRLRENIAALPQVRGVAMAEIALLAGNVDMSGIDVPGYQPKEGERMSVRENFVGAGYFSTMGIPLLAGREIGRQDGPNAPKVVIVNEQFARQYFAGDNPIGRRIRLSSKKDDTGMEIVGVVRDGKHADLREDPQTFAYYPYVQHESIMRMNFYVRTSQDPAMLGNTLRDQVRLADANLPVLDMKTVDQQINENVFADRLVALLSMFFGMLATLLAAIGLYGVMAYTVERRTREIGLRMALGAARPVVLRMVMGEVGTLALLGLSIALPAAYALSRLVQSQLYNMKSGSPVIFVAGSVAIVAVAAVAGLIPAVRATRIDPMTALRNE